MSCLMATLEILTLTQKVLEVTERVSLIASTHKVDDIVVSQEADFSLVKEMPFYDLELSKDKYTTLAHNTSSRAARV